MAPVDHHGQLHGPGPAEIVQRIQRSPDGTAGEEDVVDEDDDLAGQIDRNGGHRLGEDGAQPDVVPVERHVETAHNQIDALDLVERLGHAVGQGHPARLQADQDDVLDAPVALDHLVRHARQGTVDVSGGEDLGVGHEHGPEGSRMTAFAFCHCSSGPCEPHGTHFTVRRIP